MKKHFLYLSAILFGILVSFSSCKDSKKSSNDIDDEDEDDTELVEKSHKKSKKQSALKKVASASDLDDIDLDDVDLDELDLDDFELNNIDLDELTPEQANNLLQLVMLAGNKELPEDMGDGMSLQSMDIDGRDVVFVVGIDGASMGISMEEFKLAMSMPEVKDEMIKSIVDDDDDDMTVFFKAIVASKKNFVMRFADTQSDEYVDCRLTTSELRQKLDK